MKIDDKLRYWISVRETSEISLVTGFPIPKRVWDPLYQRFFYITYTNELTGNRKININRFMYGVDPLYNNGYNYNCNYLCNVPIVIENTQLWKEICKDLKVDIDYYNCLYFFVDFLGISSREIGGVLFIDLKYKRELPRARAIKMYMNINYSIDIHFIASGFNEETFHRSKKLRDLMDQFRHRLSVYHQYVGLYERGGIIDYEKLYIKNTMIEMGDVIDGILKLREDFRDTKEIKLTYPRFFKYFKKKTEISEVNKILKEVYNQKISLIIIL